MNDKLIEREVCPFYKFSYSLYIMTLIFCNQGYKKVSVAWLGHEPLNLRAKNSQTNYLF